MVISRKRKNLLSKKRKDSKHNNKRNTKTHNNIMTGGSGNNSIVKCDDNYNNYNKYYNESPITIIMNHQ